MSGLFDGLAWAGLFLVALYITDRLAWALYLAIARWSARREERRQLQARIEFVLDKRRDER